MDQVFKRKILIIISIVVLFVLLPLGIFIASLIVNKPNNENADKVIIIDNIGSYNRGIDKDVFSSISKAAYASSVYKIEKPENVYHGVIRNDSFIKTKDRISFILDIPSLQVSWDVARAIDKEGKGFSDASVACLPKDKLIYESKEECLDLSNGFRTIEQSSSFKITSILPLSGETYKVTYKENAEREITLVITVAGDTGVADALSAIRMLDYEPNGYKQEVIDLRNQN